MTREEYSEKLQHIVDVYPSLRIVETNDDKSDFPHGVREALIGFRDMDVANEVAEKYFKKTCIFELDRPDGHHFYTRLRDWMCDGIDVERYLSDDCITFYGTGQQYFKENKGNLMEMLENADSIEEVKDAVEQFEKICDAAYDKNDDEMLIICNGELYDTVKQQPVEFSYDSHNYVIGICEL
jgi:hypothetical protein